MTPTSPDNSEGSNLPRHSGGFRDPPRMMLYKNQGILVYYICVSICGEVVEDLRHMNANMVSDEKSHIIWGITPAPWISFSDSRRYWLSFWNMESTRFFANLVNTKLYFSLQSFYLIEPRNLLISSCPCDDTRSAMLVCDEANYKLAVVN